MILKELRAARRASARDLYLTARDVRQTDIVW
jgi:hypothetical protein